MNETPCGATRQYQRSNFARVEDRSGQERANSIANLIERSFKVSNLVFPRLSKYFVTRCTSHVCVYPGFGGRMLTIPFIYLFCHTNKKY